MLKSARSLFSMLVLSLALAVAAVAARAEPTTITFLHTNDINEIAPKRGIGGMAELMTLLEEERAAAEHSFTTFGGDLISPSILSQMLQGAQMIDLMNAIGLDVAVAGNHEFDFGPEVATQRFQESKFTWLGTNVLGKDGETLAGLVGLHTVKAGDYTVGFFGILAPETDVLSSPGKEITFAPVIITARQAVEQLKAAGADVIVALTHLRLVDTRAMVKEVEGIHLVLGGHEHEPFSLYDRGALIQLAGEEAHYLAAVDLTIDRVERRGKMVLEVRPEWRVRSTAGVAPHPEIKKIVTAYEARLDEELGQPVGTTTVVLDSRRSSVRTGETVFGNLIADAMREGVGAQVGITNGGGIRGNRTYEAGATLTRKDILSELPFGNLVVLIELSGADLVQALENGVSDIENMAGRFPHISGMSVVFDPAAAKGQRIVSAEVGGATLDPTKTYKVATNDYMFGGGDGYAALSRGEAVIDPTSAKLMATVVMEHIAAKGSVAPKLEGRIKGK